MSTSFQVGNVLFVGLKEPVNAAIDGPITVEELKKAVFFDQSDDIYLCRGGAPLCDSDVLTPSSDVLLLSAHSRLCGGKGGFGSLIRATGSHRNRNADKSACRDISGRRMRDIKDEKKMAEWIAAEKERKRERTERKKRRLQKMLEEPKHKFEDTSYMESIKSTQEGMADSLKLGLQQDTTTDTAGPSSKRPKLWLHSEELSSSEDDRDSSIGDSSESSNEDTVPSEDNTPPPTNTPPSPPSNTQSPQSKSSEEGQTNQDSEVIEDTPACDKSKPSEVPKEDTNNESPATVCEDPPTTVCEDPPATVCEDPPATSISEEVDLSQYSSVEELLALGGEALKKALSGRGLKCGGTPLERAQRLFAIKGLTQQQIPKNLWAKKKKN